MKSKVLSLMYVCMCLCIWQLLCTFYRIQRKCIRGGETTRYDYIQCFNNIYSDSFSKWVLSLDLNVWVQPSAWRSKVNSFQFLSEVQLNRRLVFILEIYPVSRCRVDECCSRVSLYIVTISVRYLGCCENHLVCNLGELCIWSIQWQEASGVILYFLCDNVVMEACHHGNSDYSGW